MPKLLLLFILVPATELALLIEIGSRIGTMNTLLLIVVTGVLRRVTGEPTGARGLAAKFRPKPRPVACLGAPSWTASSS